MLIASDQVVRFLPKLLAMPEVQAEVARVCNLPIEAIRPELLSAANWWQIQDEVSDSCVDLIFSESEMVEQFCGYGGTGEFPISVMQFGPVFYVFAPEFDKIGFYESKDDATHAAATNFQHWMLKPDDWEDEDEGDDN
ncbi:MAG: hypothetical protein JST40_12905 [Armatimonadetes bacterium]|nr:hypothetical protein [Armatimonadota bacterium]